MLAITGGSLGNILRPFLIYYSAAVQKDLKYILGNYKQMKHVAYVRVWRNAAEYIYETHTIL